MNFRKKTAIVLVLIISLSVSSFTYRAHATDWFAAAKLTMDIVAKAIAKGVFTALTNQILQKVQTGGEGGGTAFIQNWRDFQTSSQYRGENVFRAILSNTTLCPYFDKDLKRLFGATTVVPIDRNSARTGNLDPFDLRAKCTLPSNFNILNYQKDFSGNGGWEAWSRLLEPQNNYYGTLFRSLDEVARQRNLEETKATNQAVAGGGYTGISGECKISGLNGKCLFSGNTKTPGSTLKDSVSSVFDTNLKFFTTVDGASGLITAFTTILVNKLFDLGGSSNTDDPDSSEIDFATSYKNEFCSADDNMSTDPTALFIRREHLRAFEMFPPEENINSTNATNDNDVGKSYCKDKYDIDNNRLPYTRCVQACNQAVGLVAGNDLISHVPPGRAWFDSVSGVFPPDGSSGGDGGQGAPPPADAGTKHGNHKDEVIAAKASVLADGIALDTDCNIFEITKRAARAISGAGVLSKPSGRNCNSFAVDIIAFSDGYIYDDLIGSDPGGALTPTWNQTGCATSGGGIPGTCPDRYRAP